MRGLSLVVASGGHSSSRCAGLSLLQPLLLQSTGSRCTGSVIVAHRPSCSAARGIFPDQGSNPCPLHWQADSQPLRHQGSPLSVFLFLFFCFFFFFLPFLLSCAANRVLVLQPDVGPEPPRWEGRVQDTGPPETSWPHINRQELSQRSPTQH